jgi:hypothetical protein
MQLPISLLKMSSSLVFGYALRYFTKKYIIKQSKSNEWGKIYNVINMYMVVGHFFEKNRAFSCPRA